MLCINGFSRLCVKIERWFIKAGHKGKGEGEGFESVAYVSFICCA